MNVSKQLVFFTALLLAGCSGNSNPSQTSSVDVKMTVVSEDVLKVGFSLSKPVTEIFLRRTPDEQRLNRWVSNSNDFSIYHVDGQDSIRRKDGKVFSEAVFDVPMTYYAPPQDYAPFMPFKEGGVLIHSARYQSCIVPCTDEAAPSRFKMKIIPPLEDHVILFGKVLKTESTWEDTLSGTMIYVGGATPTLTEDVVTVIDSLLPEKVRDPLERVFPQLMKYYADQFGKPDTKPMLFASLDKLSGPDNNPDSNSFSTKGGVLPEQVFMHFSGDAWFEEGFVSDNQVVDFLSWHFAHEAAHIYQTLTDYDVKDQDYWIHEGGAEAFAALALQDLDLKYIDYINSKKADSIKSCLDGLTRGDLNSATGREESGLHYSCGMIMQLAIHKAIKANSDGQFDLYELWRRFLISAESEKAWNQATFLTLVETLAGSETKQLCYAIINADSSVTEELLTSVVH